MSDCTRVSQIWSEQTAGAAPCAADKQLVEHHLLRCASCRAEASALEALRITPGTNPAPALIDFERRRFIEDSVRKHRERINARHRRAVAGSRVALAAAAVALLTVGGLWLLAPKGSARQDNWGPVVESPASSQPRVDQAQLVLASGAEVFKGDVEMTPGGHFATDDTIATGLGHAVVALVPGVKVYLSDNTAIKAVQLDAPAVEIYLTRGHILVEVKPEQIPGTVRVSTRAGRVTVKGTVFSVSDEPDEVILGVLRGSVEVLQGEASPRPVIAGGRYSLTRAELETLSISEIAVARRHLETIELTNCQHCCAMEIDTFPAGAMVRLDDREMGATPIAAEIGRGTYSLSISLVGHDSIRETVRVESDSPLKRSFSLIAKHQASPEQVTGPDLATATSAQAPAVDTDADVGQAAAQIRGASLLLSQARAARKQRDWQAAAEIYQQVIVQYTDTFEAQSSWVSLGYIQLDYLEQARSALISFEEYLRRQTGGSLVQEAAYGRILALRALGDTPREAEALKDFVERFPTAIQSSSAKSRLADLSRP